MRKFIAYLSECLQWRDQARIKTNGSRKMNFLKERQIHSCQVRGVGNVFFYKLNDLALNIDR